MSIKQFRMRRALAAQSKRDDDCDRHLSDRDAAIRAAWHDYKAKVHAAEGEYLRTVDAINAGEFDHDYPGDAA